MIYGSVCSGIESATVAWKPLGWRCAFMSEVDANPRAVLAHHYPRTPLHGDFTTIRAGEYEPIDLLVGGTPCQDFSIAGRRVGLDGARGNLTLEYLRLADRLRPRWLVWENVPGVLSSNEGRDFGAFIGLLGKLGYGFAWRVLDAQFIRVDGYPRAVPQRRQRVFLVGHLGDWRPSAAALIEPEGMRRDTPPRREAGKGDPRAAAFCSGGGRQGGGLDVAATLAAHGTRLDWEVETFVAEPIGFSSKDHGADASPGVAPTMRAMGHDRSHANGGGQLAVAFSLRGRDGGAMPEVDDTGAAPAIRAASGGSTRPMVAAFNTTGQGWWNEAGGVAACLRAQDSITKADTLLRDGYTVRRLSVRECERLQGFPDDYTLTSNGRGGMMAHVPRYKMLGNSKAVSVVRWVGMRIAMVDAVLKRSAA